MVQTVQRKPPSTVLIYDGKCGFCRMWVERWMQITGPAVEYLPSQDPAVEELWPELPGEMFGRSVVAIEPDGSVLTGAQAVFRALAQSHALFFGVPRFFYEKLPGFAPLAERAYYLIAGHRNFFGRLTKLLWGRSVLRPPHILTRWLFLRGLGLIYMAAFLSLWVQIDGLVGSRGILPAGEFLTLARENLGSRAFFYYPTICWATGTSDGTLQLLCASGAALAVLVVAGIATAPALLVLWILYLSLSIICQEFLQFQWDSLLLEAGLLAIFFAPIQLLPRLWREREPPALILWLLRWLVFRLMLLSGAVKLLSGDPTWRDLSAMTFHYETQPLPTWIGWYAHQLPDLIQRLSTVSIYLIEIGLAVCVFLPRHLRIAAAAIFALLQVLILLTGNYGFFNWLSIVLCLVLLDDHVFSHRWRTRWISREGEREPPRGWPRWIIVPVAAVIMLVTAAKFILQVRLVDRVPVSLMTVTAFAEPFRSFNTYGLFAVMTTARPEILVEGSRNGKQWKEYGFYYKPDRLREKPEFVAPHMPRLDWQMWFAALGDFRQNSWFTAFCRRLLEGSAPVLELLENNPFPEAPPKYLRARLFRYTFTTPAQRSRTGMWWKREEVGLYLPVLTLRDGELVAVVHPADEQ